jgi:hypothetical protein
MRKSLATFVALAFGWALCPVLAGSEPFPQLIATKYDKRAAPDGARRPAAVLDGVDKTKLPQGVRVLATARTASGRVWVLTDRGPFRSTAGGYEPLEVGSRHPEPGQPIVNATARITDLVADPVGHIWVGTNRGVYLSDGEQWWQGLSGRDGVPYEPTRCLHLAPNGDLWAGTPEGAWRMRDGRFRYFWGRRWLPDNDVRAIWTDAAGRAWIETQTGFACIEERPMTLAQKAAHYDRIVQERHNRRGFIAAIDLKTPGDPTKGAVFDVSDNDGLWTAFYVAAMSFRFAAT